MTEQVSRRTLVATTGASTVGLLAGCLGGGKSNSAGASGAKENLKSQPRLGPSLNNTKALIVAFEDPSCPSCRHFELSTFPELNKKLIQPGKVTYVYREFPHVQKWGRPASKALEATYAHNKAAFWKLKSYYYGNAFFKIDPNNVYAKTRQYLTSHTNLNAKQIIQEVKAGKYDHALQVDEKARKKAGVTGTPTFFLFSKGSFDTKLTGAQGFSVFKNTLGV